MWPPGCASARFYVELHKLGVNIQCFDVGGGLGVDYEGTRTQSDCSVNYGLNEYASTVVWGIGEACRQNNLPHPLIITESGRATTAHHAVLVSNVIGIERHDPSEPLPPAADAPRVLHSMWKRGRSCASRAISALCARGYTKASLTCLTYTPSILSASLIWHSVPMPSSCIWRCASRLTSC